MAPESGLAEAFSQVLRQQLDRKIEARAARGKPPVDTAGNENRARWKAFVQEHPEHAPDNPWLRKGFEAARLERLALIFERELNQAMIHGNFFEESDKGRVALFTEQFAKDFRSRTGLDRYPDRLVLASEYSGREHAARERALKHWEAIARGRVIPELKRECRELLAQAADNALSPELGNGSLEDPHRREATLAALGAAMVGAGRRAAENGLDDADIPELIADAVFSLYEKTGQCPYALLLLDRIVLNQKPLAMLPGIAERRKTLEDARLALERERSRAFWQKKREAARHEEETLIDLVWPFCAEEQPLDDAAMRKAGVSERLTPLFRDMVALRRATLNERDTVCSAHSRRFSMPGVSGACVSIIETRFGATMPKARVAMEYAALQLPEEEGRALVERFRKQAQAGTSETASDKDSQGQNIEDALDNPDTRRQTLCAALLDLAARGLVTGPASPNPAVREAFTQAGIPCFSIQASASVLLEHGPLHALVHWDALPDMPADACAPDSDHEPVCDSDWLAYAPDSPLGMVCAMATAVVRLARTQDCPGASLLKAVGMLEDACSLVTESAENAEDPEKAALVCLHARFAAFLRYEAVMVPYFSETRTPRVDWVSGLLEDIPHKPGLVEYELERLWPNIIGEPLAEQGGMALDFEQYALLRALHARVQIRGKTLYAALSELFADPAYDIGRAALPDTPPGFDGPRELAVNRLIDEYRRAALDALGTVSDTPVS